jgi:radical SAM modification target selenobiotic family peptide
LPLTFSDFSTGLAKNQWVADGIPFALIVGIRFAKGNITRITFIRRYEMDQKDFKKILAGLSITTLVAGATLVGIGYPEPAQAA